jgi:hypothetical protein
MMHSGGAWLGVRKGSLELVPSRAAAKGGALGTRQLFDLAAYPRATHRPGRKNAEHRQRANHAPGATQGRRRQPPRLVAAMMAADVQAKIRGHGPAWTLRVKE